MTKANDDKVKDGLIDKAKGTDMDYDQLVDIVWEAAQKEVREEWCAKDGHDEGEPFRGNVFCNRCDQELTEAYWPSPAEMDR